VWRSRAFHSALVTVRNQGTRYGNRAYVSVQLCPQVERDPAGKATWPAPLIEPANYGIMSIGCSTIHLTRSPRAPIYALPSRAGPQPAPRAHAALSARPTRDRWRKG
jgi:hypothetical protein